MGSATERHADRWWHPDADTNAETLDSNTHADTPAGCDTNRESHANPSANGISDRYPDRHAFAGSDPDANGHSLALAHPDADANTESNIGTGYSPEPHTDPAGRARDDIDRADDRAQRRHRQQ